MDQMAKQLTEMFGDSEELRNIADMAKNLNFDDPRSISSLMGNMMNKAGMNGTKFSKTFVNSFEKMKSGTAPASTLMRDAMEPLFDVLELGEDCNIRKQADLMVEQITSGVETAATINSGDDMESFVASMSKMDKTLDALFTTIDSKKECTIALKTLTVKCVILNKHRQLTGKWNATTTDDEMTKDIEHLITTEGETEYERDFIAIFRELNNSKGETTSFLGVAALVIKGLVSMLGDGVRLVNITIGILNRETSKEPIATFDE